MAKKCCKSDPPCKGCPKLKKKKKKHGKCEVQAVTAAVHCSIWPIFTLSPGA